MNDMYQRCQFSQIKMNVSRLYTENSITGIYSSGVPQLHVAYFPGLQAGSLTNNLVLNCETGSKIEPYHVTVFKRSWDVPSIQGLDSTSAISLDMGKPFETSNLPGYTVPGVIGIGWNPNGNAASSTVLAQVTFEILATFDIPY
jgi:hypothetical protein